MLRFLIITFLAFTIQTSPLQAQDLPRLFQVTGVAADDTLNIRQIANATALIIGHLTPTETHIEVSAFSEDQRWGQINTGEQSGWVFMRYMADMRDPAWWELPRPLFCFGTEPFWSATIDAETSGGLEINIAGAPNYFMRYDWLRASLGWGSIDNPKGVTANFTNSSGSHKAVTTMRTHACDDGMSDGSYGIAIQLFTTQESAGDKFSHRSWSGCCSLSR